MGWEKTDQPSSGWLLSAISALSEFEGAIATLFRNTRRVQDAGPGWVIGGG